MRGWRRLALVIAMIVIGGHHASADSPARFTEQVTQLCRDYWNGFGSPATEVVYHHRLNGPKGLAALSSPAEIERGEVNGRPMPYGYGSGIQDVALENGQFLFALCDAYDATREPYLGEMARRICHGMQRLAVLSPEPGFVPRGPHPDGKSYYRNSSRDQHAALVEALWRYGRSSLATDEDRRFIAERLRQVAQRMDRNGWKIRVEDNGEVAHVGFSWLGHTTVPSVTLLSCLALVQDATGDERWGALYRQFSDEKEGIRWTQALCPTALDERPPLTLYFNQFAHALAAWERVEKEPARRTQLAALQRKLALRMLDSNVFDPQAWRRLDWAGEDVPAVIERQLAPFGLSLDRKATVFDVYAAFKPEIWQTGDAATKRINGKLCFGLPTVACHTALLTRDPELVRRVTPMVKDMVDKMLVHGRHYHGGEDFNRVVILGLLLLAQP